MLRAIFIEVICVRRSVKKMVTLAMLAAVAYLLMVLIRIPVVLFLNYEPKDVVITVSGFLFEPLSAMAVSLVVSLVEMVTVSGTGPIGALMNFLSTCCFACTAAFIYRKKRTMTGALVGLLAGSALMVVVMLLWNWLITPLYMEVPRPVVEGMLLPVFLPFNALKAGLNTALTMLLYKPLVTGMRRVGLLEQRPRQAGRGQVGFYLLAALILASCVLGVLALSGVI